MKNIHVYLSAHPLNVVVIHCLVCILLLRCFNLLLFLCAFVLDVLNHNMLHSHFQAGKGRTGTAIACYLIYSGYASCHVALLSILTIQIIQWRAACEKVFCVQKEQYELGCSGSVASQVAASQWRAYFWFHLLSGRSTTLHYSAATACRNGNHYSWNQSCSIRYEHIVMQCFLLFSFISFLILVMGLSFSFSFGVGGFFFFFFWLWLDLDIVLVLVLVSLLDLDLDLDLGSVLDVHPNIVDSIDVPWTWKICWYAPPALCLHD
jgi:hypothetical protein